MVNAICPAPSPPTPQSNYGIEVLSIMPRIIFRNLINLDLGIAAVRVQGFDGAVDRSIELGCLHDEKVKVTAVENQNMEVRLRSCT